MLTFPAWIEQYAYLTPERLALVGERERLTYQELAQKAMSWAVALHHEYDLKAGERVAILAINCSEYMLLFFALAKLGVIVVPLNTRLHKAELAYQLNDSTPQLLIVDHSFQALGQELQQGCSIPALTSLAQLATRASEYLEQPLRSIEMKTLSKECSWEEPFLIMYTSGTTGRPKGAVLTHQNLYWNAVNNLLGLEISSQDRILTILPLFHIGGLGLFALSGFLAGATVVVPDGFTPEKTLQVSMEEKITIMMGVPTIFQLLRQSPQFERTDLSSLRWWITGGAPCPLELFHFFWERGIPFAQGFGTTETSPTVFLTPQQEMYKKPGTVGKAVMFTQIRAVDEGGAAVPPGEVGELVVRGPNVFKEYWKRPEETATSFQAGWFHTGDLIRIDEEGFVSIVGRKKEMIISGGENIYPLEVEQVLYEHPALADAVVIGIPHSHWGEVPVAVVVRKEGKSCSGKELFAYCEARLAKYKCPKRFHFVTELPTNATGKVDKRLLQQELTALDIGR